MSFNGSGVFNINTTGLPVVTATAISTTMFNALTADLGTGLTNAICKDGQSTPTANIPMGGFKITGIAVATTTGDALSYGRAASITTLTLTNALAVAQGGTASTTEAGARTALAVPGLATANAFTAQNTFSGASTTPAMKLLNALEAVTITGTAVAAAATINFDLSTQSVVWYNVDATGNPTAVNFRLSAGTTLNSAMAVGESVTACMLIKNGATAYFLNTSRLTVDTGGTVTVLWQGVEPTVGSINSTDIYSFVITKTAATTWTIFASQAAFV